MSERMHRVSQLNTVFVHCPLDGRTTQDVLRSADLVAHPCGIPVGWIRRRRHSVQREWKQMVVLVKTTDIHCDAEF